MDRIDLPAERFADPDGGADVILGAGAIRVRSAGAGRVEIARTGLPETGRFTVYIREGDAEGLGGLHVSVHGTIGDGEPRARDDPAERSGRAIGVFVDPGAPPCRYWIRFGTDDGWSNCDLRGSWSLRTSLDPAPSRSPSSSAGSAARTVTMPSPIRRSPGWHKIRIDVTPHGTLAWIDGVNLARTLPMMDGALPFDPHLTRLERIALGALPVSGAAGTIAYIDNLSYEPLPPTEASPEAFARAQLEAFLRAYGRLSDPDQLALAGRVLAGAGHGDGAPADPAPPHDGLALLWSYGWTATAHAVRYRLDGTADDRRRAERVLRFLRAQQGRWSAARTVEPTLSSTVLQALLVPAWLLWDELDPATRGDLRALTVAELARIEAQIAAGAGSDHPFGSAFIGDSTAEQNAQPLGSLAVALALFPADAAAPRWRDRLAFHAHHVATDSGSPGRGGSRTQTVWDEASVAAAERVAPVHAAIRARDPEHRDDHLLDNHDFHPHPNYGMSVALPAHWQRFLERAGVRGMGLATPLQRDVLVRMLGFSDPDTFRFRGDGIHRLRRPGGSGPPFDLTAPNVFQATGRDDWGADGFNPLALLALRDVYGVPALTDPATGRRVPDALGHVLAVGRDLGYAALRAPTKDGVRFRHPADLDRSTPGSVAYDWEMLNMPQFALGYYVMYAERIAPPRSVR